MKYQIIWAYLFLWNLDGVSGGQLKSELKLRLSDTFKQNWNSDIDTNVLCINYQLFKTELKYERYLSILDPANRKIFSKFRFGSHNLPIKAKSIPWCERR